MSIPHPFLSLIVPAFNEAATVVQTLAAMRDYLARQTWDWEIIVSADGVDGTRERVAELVREFLERNLKV